MTQEERITRLEEQVRALQALLGKKLNKKPKKPNARPPVHAFYDSLYAVIDKPGSSLPADFVTPTELLLRFNDPTINVVLLGGLLKAAGYKRVSRRIGTKVAKGYLISFL